MRGSLWARSLPAIGLGLLLVASGCGRAPTRVLVVVDAQAQVRARTSSLRLEVRKPSAVVSGVPVWDRSVSSDQTEPAFGEEGAGSVPRYPFTVLLEQESESPFYELRVSVLDEMNRLLVEQGLRGRFVAGETRLVRLTLVDGCLGVSCDDPEQVCGCPEGSGDALNCRQPLGCVAASDVGEGESYEAEEVYVCDGGSCRVRDIDGGAEGGMDAGMDGGTDAGTDAGMDAGTDGGMDAGGPPLLNCASADWIPTGVQCIEAPDGCDSDASSPLPDCTASASCQRPVCGQGTEVDSASFDPCQGSPMRWCAPGSGTAPRCTEVTVRQEAAGWPSVGNAPMAAVGPPFGATVAVAGSWVAVAELPATPPTPPAEPIERVVIFRIEEPPGSSVLRLTDVARIGPAEDASTLTPLAGDSEGSVRGFGRALAMAEDGGDVWLAVGAPGSGPDGAGAVFLYRWPAAGSPPSPLRPERVLSAPFGGAGSSAGAGFGTSVAMREQARELHLLVGVPQSPETGPGMALLYRLQKSGTSVDVAMQLAWLGGSEMGSRFFGAAVAMDARRLYAAGFMRDGRAGVAVLDWDSGDSMWVDDSGGSAEGLTRLCSDRDKRTFYPPLDLSTDEGVLALLQGYLFAGGSVRHSGSVTLWERWSTGSEEGWFGPQTFLPRADISESGLDALYSVSVASGRLVIGGQGAVGGSFNRPRFQSFLQVASAGRWRLEEDRGLWSDEAEGHVPGMSAWVGAVAQYPGDARRTLLLGIVSGGMSGVGAVRLIRAGGS